MTNNYDQLFNEVYTKTYHETLKFVISKTDNLSNIEDIMQNIYLRLYRIINKNNYLIDNYQALIIKLSKNELFKYYSLKNKIKVIFNNDYEEVDKIANIKDPKINLEQEVLNSVSLEAIWKFIKQEDILTQKIITLYYLEDLKIKEIAKLLNMNEVNVKNHLYRTIKKLKEKFNERNEQDE